MDHVVMDHVVIIQSYIRKYLQQKKYITLYNATYKIQCFILHRLDVSIILENVKYLSNYSKSEDKYSFLKKHKVINKEDTNHVRIHINKEKIK